MGQQEEGLKKYLIGLSILHELNLEPKELEEFAITLLDWNAQIGNEKFNELWEKVSGENLIGLGQSPQHRQDKVKQFIVGAIQSAREKRPEAEEYFKSAQKMAADSNVPAEMRELGRVLTRILAGDTKVDLSGLPNNLADAVRAALK